MGDRVIVRAMIGEALLLTGFGAMVYSSGLKAQGIENNLTKNGLFVASVGGVLMLLSHFSGDK